MTDSTGSPGRVPAPARIGRRDPSKITFDWQDGVSNGASAAAIRRGCPCAHCIDEHTGRPLLDPSSVPDHLTQKEVVLVGNYAISIVFSDGHRTGIFTWANLRRIADAASAPAAGGSQS
ncbi:hypothetical protein Poly30_52430 [Planctomycetes bacterium Poly30]|uniref:Gamma-butyrobetaine hydroxylase-like N-terminal domain-containing protein n=1 Tax=Saltatorellus ferox TaxID=2528018 RepID=A0A518F018_9BACT|nr:hypothetical protein Poly30_52430 [Planctomycetes bacterium Poly30]